MNREDYIKDATNTGDALSEWESAAPGGVAHSMCVSNGSAELQLHKRDLQDLRWPCNWLVEFLTATAKGWTTEFLYLLLSHMSRLGYLNYWAHCLWSSGGKKSASIII